MKKFKITVWDDFFKMELSGEFEAETQESAEQIAKEFYAYELDTVEDEIEIISIIELK